MSERYYYVLFSDSKKSEKVSRNDFLNIRFVAKGLDAILSEVIHRYGVTLSVSFSRSLYDHYYLSSL